MKTKDNKVTLDIPDEFINKNIEIIVFPSEEEKTKEKNEFIKFLQNGPTLNNEEISNIENVGKRINQWE